MSLSLLDIRFVALLALAALLRGVWPKRYYALYGAVMSALLIGLTSPATLITITALTLLVLYPLHRLIWIAHSRGVPASTLRFLPAIGILLLVVLFLAFKLHRHFTVPLLANPYIGSNLIALIGFSYFVLRGISLLHIQSILKNNVSSPWTFLFYTLFPPTITSGPIQKFEDFRQQATNPLPLTASLGATAAYRITRGYFLKVVLAFSLNEVVSAFLKHPQLTILTSITIIALLYVYFYFDFAGYSDIAIGFGLLAGIKVPENFRKPFAATTVSEFWRNWHITLVDWFRENVFIPLGGMQANRYRAAALAFLIMVLCGAWHGLTLAFIIWGAWHGTVLAIEALSGSRPVPPSQRSGSRYWARALWTNVRVALPCILFLPNESIVHILRGLATWY